MKGARAGQHQHSRHRPHGAAGRLWALAGGWRGPIDVIAVGFYLFGIVPLGGVALLELGLIGRGLDGRGRLKLHAVFVGLFLVTAHVAMIAGMLDPTLIGGGGDMPGMGGHMH